MEEHLLFIVSDLCVSKPPVTHAHTVSDKLMKITDSHSRAVKVATPSVLVSLMTSCLGHTHTHTHPLFYVGYFLL